MISTHFESGPLATVVYEPADTGWTLAFTRDLPHSAERVWAALTQRDQLGQWAPFVPNRDLDVQDDATFKMEDVGGQRLVYPDSSMLENMIAFGTAGVTNPTLTSAGEITPAAEPVPPPLGTAEAFLLEESANVGAGGTFHMSPVVAAQVEGLLEERDGKLYTKTTGRWWSWGSARRPTSSPTSGRLTCTWVTSSSPNLLTPTEATSWYIGRAARFGRVECLRRGEDQDGSFTWT